MSFSLKESDVTVTDHVHNLVKLPGGTFPVTEEFIKKILCEYFVKKVFTFWSKSDII